jgi:NAD(P)-dependent dehydrogenase (short-subunit alcohol dehydrogenase family)
VASRTGPSRVVWMSSFEARADVYDAEDWQLVDNPNPYEASKFAMDLIRAELSRRAGPSAPIRYFTVQPGVVSSSIDAQISSGILLYLKHIFFYLMRFFPFLYECLEFH